ncbi:NUDC3 protein, partial [Circaetus pectoralis]|nr:NUDC3 protein [Circaetus pectoralis]
AAAALTDMYDQGGGGILQHVGNVEEFLGGVFGFLYRKTDFYRGGGRPGDRLGFPPGAGGGMALQRMARQDDEKGGGELEAKLRKKEEEGGGAAAAERVKLSPAGGGVEVETTAEHVPEPDAGEAAGTQDLAVAQGGGTSPVSAEPPGAAAPAEPQPAELPTRQEQFQTNPDSGGGAVRENYAWSQDYRGGEIKVPVPKHIVKGGGHSRGGSGNLPDYFLSLCLGGAVDISSGAIRVAVGGGSSQRVLMEGKLTRGGNTESSLWSLEPGKGGVISLNKGDEYGGGAILEGEEQIDIDRGGKERSMATVDEEEHAVLDRLTFDYHQKLQGKPQSHELPVASLGGVHEMLKKGWDTEGGGGRGQKFDPSMFNIWGGAVQF